MKRKVEKTPLAGERIKNLITGKMTQRQLSEAIYISEKHLSQIIHGRKPLTRDNAELIAGLFPDVRAEWLLGKDNWKTEAEAEQAGNEAFDEGWYSEVAFSDYIKSFGFVYKTDLSAKNEIPFKYADEETGEVLTDVAFGSNYIFYRDGVPTAECTGAELDALITEVKDFAIFKINRLRKQKG